MLGCLVAAAVVAVGAILLGNFDDIAWRALGTVLVAAMHIGILLVVISTTATKSSTSMIVRSSNFAINVAVVVAILSFITSVFGIWDILDGNLAAKLYGTYGIVLFATLHSKSLIDAQVVYAKIKPFIYANYIFVGIVSLLLAGAIWSEFDLLDGFYGRLLAASAIIDATLSIIIGVMQRLHVQKNTEIKPEQLSSLNSGVRALVTLISLLFVVGLIFSFTV